MERGRANGVPGLAILSKEEVLSLIEQDEEVSTQLKTTEIDEIEEVSDIS